MRIRADAKAGRVIVELSAREAVMWADKLMRAAIASSPDEDWSKQTVLTEKETEQGQ